MRYPIFNYTYRVLVVKNEKYYPTVETLAEANNAEIAIAAYKTARRVRTRSVIQLCNGARIMRTEWTIDVAGENPPIH